MMRLARGALLTALFTFPFTTIDAQGLGKILKKAKDKAVDAAAKATDGKKSDSSATAPATKGQPAAAAAATPAPAATPSATPAPASVTAAPAQSGPRPDGPPLEITTEHIDLFIPVMKADADRRAGLLGFRKDIKTYLSCKTAAQRNPGGYALEKTKAHEAATAYREGLEKRWSALFNVKPDQRDHLAMDFLRDTIEYARELENQHGMPAMLKCGKPPFPPAGYRLTDGQKGSDERFKLPQPSPVLPAGMSVKQFGLLRERIGYWLLSKGTIGEPLIGPAEAAVLKARLTELAPYTEYFAQGAMPYKDWGDVWSWK